MAIGVIGRRPASSTVADMRNGGSNGPAGVESGKARPRAG